MNVKEQGNIKRQVVMSKIARDLLLPNLEWFKWFYLLFECYTFFIFNDRKNNIQRLQMTSLAPLSEEVQENDGWKFDYDI